jgi:hypothetical protein
MSNFILIGLLYMMQEQDSVPEPTHDENSKRLLNALDKIIDTQPSKKKELQSKFLKQIEQRGCSTTRRSGNRALFMGGKRHENAETAS